MTLDQAMAALDAELLASIEARVASQRATGSQAFARRMIREEELRHAIDLICREFGKELKWPIAGPEEGLYVFDRLSEARSCGLTLQAAGMGEAKAEWLHWLLIDYWEHAGLLRWRERARLF